MADQGGQNQQDPYAQQQGYYQQYTPEQIAYYQQQQQQYFQDYYLQENAENYDQDDYDNLDEIEREMGYNAAPSADEDYALLEIQKEIEKDEKNNAHAFQKPKSGGAYLPAGAVPQQNGVLSPQAAEFWFPESRNCPCCKGFKHGCPCRRPGIVDSCTNPECTTATAPAVEAPVEPLPVKDTRPKFTIKPPVRSTTTTTNTATNTPIPAQANTPPAPPAGEYCKFEISATGCRFGASCRFLHRNTATSSGGKSPTSLSSSSSFSTTGSKCIYFAKGNCQYGDSCRNIHES